MPHLLLLLSPYAELFFPTHHPAEKKWRNSKAVPVIDQSQPVIAINELSNSFIRWRWPKSNFTLPCAFYFIRQSMWPASVVHGYFISFVATENKDSQLR